MKVSAFMADGLEEVECLAVVDVLRRADIAVEMVSMGDTCQVTGSHQITIQTDTTFDKADYTKTDLLFLPGGMPGTTHLEESKGLAELLKQFNAEQKGIAAICAAPSVLGKLGLLEGRNATCYPGFEETLKGAHYTGAGVERDGHVITGRGLGFAIDLGLAIIEMLKGEDAMQAVKAAIQHPETL